MTVLAFLESALPSFCLSYKIQCQEATVTVLAVSAVVAVSVVTATYRARKKPININSLGGTVSGTNGTPSLGQTGPRPWDKLGPSLGQTGRFLFTSTVKSPFCPVCPWDRWGFVPGTTVPARAVRKMFMCFLFIGFFRPQTYPLKLNPAVPTSRFVSLLIALTLVNCIGSNLLGVLGN